MTLSTVIFQLQGNNCPYSFDRSRLKLGATVYVEFDDSGSPKDFYSNPTLSSTPYFVMWIAPSNWSVVLQDKFIIEDSFQERVFKAINGLLDKETITSALNIAAQDIRPEQMYKTSELNNSKVGVVSTVIDRLNLYSILSEAATAKQLFHHYTPLVVYLLLTCFDRLGQPADWVDFGSWLKSHDKKKEREQVVLTDIEGSSEIAVAFYDTYNRIYGVTNSFYRFLHEIIPAPIYQELLDSMSIEIVDNPPNISNSRQADNAAKEKFLFKLRNDYTHKAQFIPGTTKAIWPDGTFANGSWMMTQQTIEQSSWNTLFVRNWPETIEKVVRVGLAVYIERIISK